MSRWRCSDGEDRLVLEDLRLELGVALEDLLALQRGQPAQLQVEDRVRLELVDVEQLHQAGAGLVRVGRPADERDDLVERVERLEVPAVDVDVRLGLAQLERGAADDDLELVRDPVAHERVDAQRARDVVDEREHVRAERVLQLRVLVEVVQHDLRDGVALEHDHQALAGAAGRLVADVRDAGDLVLADQVRDLLRQRVGVHLVRQLGDDQADAVLDLLDLDDRAHRDGAAPGAVRLLDALVAQDRRAGREVRALDAQQERREQLLARRLGVVQVPLDALGDLAQVVRRDVGRHADRDAGRAVDQQVREPRRQDRRAPACGRRSCPGSRRCPCRCPGPSPWTAAPSCTRCTAGRPPGRRPGSRSCPGRTTSGYRSDQSCTRRTRAS